MQFRSCIGAAALGVVCVTATARSQVTSDASKWAALSRSAGGLFVSSRVQADYSQYHFDSAGTRTDWMQYFILWRGQPDWGMDPANDTKDLGAPGRAFGEAGSAAAAAGREFIGAGRGAPYWFEIDESKRRLSLLGHEFALPPRGSALVVLIDRVDGVGGPPIVVSSAVIGGHLPPDVWGNSRTAGDTTVSIRPAKSGTAVFLDALRRDPPIAAFLGEAPRSPN